MERRTALAVEKNVAEVVVGLQHLCRSAAVDLSYRIGELIIDSLFEGSIARWRADGTRQIHYRELAKHPELPLSASALCRSVGIYALCSELDGHSNWRHVGTGHVQEVLPLEPPEQARLIAQAEAEKWTVRRLRSEVAQLRPLGGGRSRRPGFSRVVRDMNQHLRRQLDALHQAKPQRLDEEAIRDVRSTLEMLNEHCELLERALHGHESQEPSAQETSETRLTAAPPPSTRSGQGRR